MTDDEKKALIVAGGIGVIGLAIWLSKGGAVIPAGAAGVQNAPVGIATPGYTTYNIPPFAGIPVSNLSTPSNDNPIAAVQGGACCGDGDGCFTAGGINSGNAPTSLTQLLNLYSKGNPNFLSAFASQGTAFDMPPQTLMEQTAPPLSGNSNVIF